MIQKLEVFLKTSSKKPGKSLTPERLGKMYLLQGEDNSRHEDAGAHVGFVKIISDVLVVPFETENLAELVPKTLYKFLHSYFSGSHERYF